MSAVSKLLSNQADTDGLKKTASNKNSFGSDALATGNAKRRASKATAHTVATEDDNIVLHSSGGSNRSSIGGSQPLASPRASNASSHTVVGNALPRHPSITPSQLQKRASTGSVSQSSRINPLKPSHVFVPFSKPLAITQSSSKQQSQVSNRNASHSSAKNMNALQVPTNSLYHGALTSPKRRSGDSQLAVSTSSMLVKTTSQNSAASNDVSSPTLFSPLGNSPSASSTSPTHNSFITSTPMRRNNSLGTTKESQVSPSLTQIHGIPTSPLFPNSPSLSVAVVPQSHATKIPATSKPRAKRMASLTSMDKTEPKVPRQLSTLSLDAKQKKATLLSNAAAKNKPQTTNDVNNESSQMVVGKKIQQTIFSPSYNHVHNSSVKQEHAVSDESEHNDVSMDTSEHHKHLTRENTPVLDQDSDSSLEDDDTEDIDPYDFIKTLPTLPKTHDARAPVLPKKTRSSPPITLVLDLDETLVHCSTMPLEKFDISFPVEFSGVTYSVHGRIRPYHEAFLKRVSEIFEVVVFTASQKIYADKVLNIIDPEHKYIKYRLFRDSCLVITGNYLKDLSVLGRDLAKTIIVDNSPQAFGYHLSNGIPILSWYDNYQDTELLKVLEFLEKIVNVDDVRPHIKRAYKLEKKIFGI